MTKMRISPTQQRHKLLTWEHLLLILLTLLAIIAVCVILLRYNTENNEIRIFDESSFNQGAIEDVKFEIEPFSEEAENEAQIIKGWFILPGVTYQYYNYGNDAERSGVYNYLNLCFIKDGKVYVLPTKLELRDDVNNIISDGIDYRYSGFRANVPENYSHLIKEGSIAFLVQNPDGVNTLYAQEGAREQ